MKNGPKHFMDAEELEPLYTPQENVLEECLRKEVERVAHSYNLINRFVYKCDSAPKRPSGDNSEEDDEPTEVEETKDGDANIVYGSKDMKKPDNPVD